LGPGASPHCDPSADGVAIRTRSARQADGQDATRQPQFIAKQYERWFIGVGHGHIHPPVTCDVEKGHSPAIAFVIRSAQQTEIGKLLAAAAEEKPVALVTAQ
jgi:hypothetical protein